MSIAERLELFINFLGISTQEFENKCNISGGTASRITSKSYPKTFGRIASAYPQLNIDWLKTGNGEMLIEEESSIEPTVSDDSQTLIPLVHIDSVGGIRSKNQLTSSEQYIERMIPFPDGRPGDVAIIQSGNSMAPTIPAGAILQIRKVEGWREYFGYGNDFVLWLSDDRRITKQVLKYSPDPKNYVTCHSYNPESADEELPKDMIQEVWKVVNVLIHKGW